MLAILKRIYKKIIKNVLGYTDSVPYDFNKSNPLGDNGERVDIQLNGNINFGKLDIYQKSHWKRYEFAKEIINAGDVCGDFACGTGYGSILIASKAQSVTGADLNKKVITEIKERYKKYESVNFINENLLNLSFADYFDSIVSFETLEHFDEANIVKLLSIFGKALKKKGQLIFSTPYMQEQSEQAMKMGFHLTFNIDEKKIKNWMEEAGMQIQIIKYQNYDTHTIENDLSKKEFIICVGGKIMNDA